MRARALIVGLALFAAVAVAQYPTNRYFEQPNLSRFISNAIAAPYDGGYFELYRSDGYGGVAACAATNPKGITADGDAGVALTFTRATVAECISQDGQTITQLGTGVMRSMTGATDRSVVGFLGEPAATNSALYAHDFSQAATWVPSNMTCTKTATGLRGTANSGSTCTASAGNGTVLQTFTTGAATRTTSGYIKRRTGTGNVYVTRDNGGTYSDITASVSASEWRRIVPKQTVGCMGSAGATNSKCIVVAAMTSGGANPVFGIKLATSGDAVDLDFWQDEAGAEATTPIETTTIAVVRNADGTPKATMGAVTASAPWCVGSTIVWSGGTGATPRVTPVWGITGVGSYVTAAYFASTNLRSDSTAYAAHLSTLPYVLATTQRVNAYHDGTNSGLCVAGTCQTSAKAYTPLANSVEIDIANYPGSAMNYGVVSEVILDNTSATRCPR